MLGVTSLWVWRQVRSVPAMTELRFRRHLRLVLDIQKSSSRRRQGADEESRHVFL